MNLNDPIDIPLLTTQPSAITRRSFIKRTASTALVATLALGAFENEALAEAGGGSSKWTLQTTVLGQVYEKVLPPNSNAQHPITEKPKITKQVDINGNEVSLPTPKVVRGPWYSFKVSGNETRQLRIVLKSTPRPVFVETQFPTNPNEWGYFSKKFYYEWGLVGGLEMRKIATDTGNEIEAPSVPTGPAFSDEPIYSYGGRFEGSVAINESTGETIESPSAEVTEVVGGNNPGAWVYTPTDLAIVITRKWKSSSFTLEASFYTDLPGARGGVKIDGTTATLDDRFTWVPREYLSN